MYALSTYSFHLCNLLKCNEIGTEISVWKDYNNLDFFRALDLTDSFFDAFELGLVGIFDFFDGANNLSPAGIDYRYGR